MSLARKLEVEHLSDEALLFFQGSIVHVYGTPFFKVKLRGHLVTLCTTLVKNVLNYDSDKMIAVKE